MLCDDGCMTTAMTSPNTDQASVDGAQAGARCARCHRPITSARALRTGYGPGCYTRVRRAVPASVAGVSDRIRERAVEAVADRALVRVGGAVFRAVSSDGSDVYTVMPHACTCRAAQAGRMCYHRVAAAIILAA